MAHDRILTQHPDASKQGVSIVKWKYEAVRRVMLAALPAEAPGLAFADLAEVLRAGLTEDERSELGSLKWYATTVKLDLEARGELQRLSGRGPQRLIRG